MIDGQRQKAMQDFLVKHYELWKSGTQKILAGGFTKYSRKEITRELITLFA
jgi:hypothetical protein